MWILFGFVFKVLGLLPRHREIVAAIVGEEPAGPLTVVIGVFETALGLWILSGIRPRLCAAAQTLAIFAMNTLELSLAGEHLLAPLPMVLANTAFLGAGWYIALRKPVRPASS